jgi:type IV secretion system protein VirD4
MSNAGFLIGEMESSRPSLLSAAMALFHPGVESSAASLYFLASMRTRQKQLVRIPVVHTAIFAPTGVGKGVSCVIPHLLTCPDSCVVVDFKGENARVTAKVRRAMGHRVVLLDPFRVVTTTPDTFNPLDFIPRDSDFAIDECQDLAEALVVRTGQEKEPHWLDSAQIWIAAMTATVVHYGNPDNRSLQKVREMLTDPENMERSIRLMCESDAWGGMLARLGHQLTHFKDRELGSTLTTTNRFLRFLDTLAVADSTRSSSFDPSQLVRGKMTVFLVLPPEHMRAQSALLRMWISSLLRAVVRGGLQEKNKVHFILDEAASLGHMDCLDDATDKCRGYGIRLQLYYQSLGQLQKCWPEGGDQTLLSNCTQVFFGVNDNKTAEFVSNRLGEETIVIESGGKTTSRSYQSSDHGNHASHSTNWNSNWQQHGRKLLKPEEVMGLDERVAITFTQGCPPIATRLVRHYEGGLKQPGWLWPMVKAFTESVVLLMGFVFFAYALTLYANQGQASVPWLPPQRERAPGDEWMFR